jgi:hypothetical protein
MVGVMTVGVMSVGEITGGVMTVGVMRRPQIYTTHQFDSAHSRRYS